MGGSGVVQLISSLADVQGAHFAAPTVIISDSVGGNEDIPVSFPWIGLRLLAFENFSF